MDEGIYVSQTAVTADGKTGGATEQLDNTSTAGHPAGQIADVVRSWVTGWISVLQTGGKTERSL